MNVRESEKCLVYANVCWLLRLGSPVCVKASPSASFRAPQSARLLPLELVIHGLDFFNQQIAAVVRGHRVFLTWWETGWFYALCALVVLIAFGLLYRHKVKQLRKERALTEALRESEQRFKGIVQSAPLGVGIVDSEGNLIGCNQALANMVGYSQDELLHLNFADLTHPDDLERERELIRDMWAQQTHAYTMEKRYIRKDQTMIWVKVVATVVKENGALKFGFAFVEDITDRKEVEQALQQSEKELQLTLEATTDGIWKWNFETDNLFFSSRYYTMLGYEPDEFPATYENWRDMIHPDDRKHALAVATTYLATKPDLYENEFRLRTKQGDYRWIHSYARVVERHDTGEAIRMIGNHVDITERKQAEDKLKASLAEKEVLLRELYHRTKNTLQIIRSMLMLQADRLLDNDQVQQLVRDTENRIMTIALIHQKLYQSQDLSHLKISEYIRELADFLLQGFYTPSQHISLVFEIEDLPMLFDTAVPCGLIVNELLSNAMKHAFPDGRNGKITVKLFKNDAGNIELQIADNGVGIPQDFDFRGQNTFGLPTVIAIVEHQMQGTIRFTGQAGVRCLIEFPETLYAQRI